jgi:WD40 repeat protein/tRNA A-37 threonylcarbamoyl transferase component Bud32
VSETPWLESAPLSELVGRLVDQVCNRFEAACKAGGQHRVEDILGDTPEPARSALLRELIVLEVYYRRARGEGCRAEEYLARFPDLDLAWLAEAVAGDAPAGPASRAAPRAEAARPAEATTPPQADTLAPEAAGQFGSRVGDYELLEEIARGGMGVVFKARQKSLNRIVALKMILAGQLASPEEVQRFLAEAEAIARLKHPNVVQVHEVGDSGGIPFFAMEYCEGGNLNAQLDGTPWPPDKAAALVRTLANALHAAHQAGIVHRDLKPANVLLAEDGTPKVTDFGLARRLDVQGQTRTGAIMGTPSYMAPEQASGKGKEAGPAADVYALGAILYELLTGRPPFRAATDMETLVQVISQEPVAVRRLQPGVPKDLETVCHKCLEKEPRKRYPSAEVLAHRLRLFLEGKPIPDRPIGVWGHALKWARRRPAVAALLAAVVGTVFVATALVTWQWRAAVAEHRRAEWLRLRRSLERGGQLLGEKGDIGQGILWLADAHQIALQEEPDLGPAIRANLGAWSQRLHPLRELLPHPVPVRTVALSPDGVTILTVGGKVAWLWQTTKRGQMASSSLELPHPHEIATAAFSPNSRLVLTFCDDGTPRLWDAVQGRLVRALGEKDAGTVEVAAFAPDGQSVATGHRDGKVRLWETGTGRLLPMGRPGHVGPVRALAFRPQGATLLTGGADGAIRSWDARTLQPARPTFPQQGGEVRTLCFSPDGRRLLTVSKDKRREGAPVVQLWDAATGEPTADLPHHYWVWAVAFSPDNRLVCTGGEDHTAQLWETGTGKAVFEHPLRHQDIVRAVAFSPDGKTLLTGSDDQTARLWDVASGRPTGQPLEHQGRVQAVSFGPDGRSLLTASADRTARIWGAAPTEPFVRELKHDTQVMSLAWAPDGETVATGTDDSRAWRWRAVTGVRLRPELPHKDDVWVVAYDPAGTVLLTGSRDCTAKLWDATTGKLLQTLPHRHRVRSAAFSPDGKVILTGSGDTSEGEARFWDTALGTPHGPPLSKGEVVWQVAFCPDGATCATASGEDRVTLWDVATWNARPLLDGHQNRVVALAFSPDGRTLLTGSTDKTARLWNVATARPRGEPLQHPGAVWSGAFSHDGRTIVTGCQDGTALLWDAATGTRVGPPLPHGDAVWAVACHPRDALVLTGSADRTARLWRLPDPVEADPERIKLWVQVSTGMELDDRGVRHWLDPDTWRDRQRRLHDVGHPRLP